MHGVAFGCASLVATGVSVRAEWLFRVELHQPQRQIRLACPGLSFTLRQPVRPRIGKTMNTVRRTFQHQSQLIAALLDGSRYPHGAKSVRLFETHISWVLLAGRYAYKIKKAADLGFLDFSTLEKRQFFCNEEIRLNRRLAPQIYLDAVPIGGRFDAPVIGQEPAIEYAVRMRRFSSASEMDRLLRHGQVWPQQIDSLAAVLAQFHFGLPPALPDSHYGTASAIGELALQNCGPLPPAAQEFVGSAALEALRVATKVEFTACQMLIAQRRAQGFVRECHGDLHLGNILIRGGKAVPFDGIEFNPLLRWGDIVGDIAFPFMDLQHFGRADFAWRLLNGWLEMTGDFDGLPLLRFFCVVSCGRARQS